jgi:peptidyl-prolyl cis-trans isomerase B (cyclophilin B)
VSGKQAKRELRRQRDAAREQARRKHRQQTLFTGIVILIIVAIGGVIIYLSARPTTPEELAAGASEAAASEGASEGASESVVPVTERPVACGGQLPRGAGKQKPTFEEPEQVTRKGTNYRAVITTSCGRFTVDLLERQAPETVNSFVFLAQEGFFDGLAIFRNASTIGALQTGAGTNEAAFDVGYTIPDELRAAKDDGYTPGTLAMANAGPDTGGSQFFFVYNDRFKLPPQYAVFGRTDAEGRRILSRIGRIPTLAPDAQPGDPAGEAPARVAWIESVEIID